MLRSTRCSIHFFTMLLFVLVLVFTGCPSNDDEQEPGDYFPSGDGSQWVYSITDYENNGTISEGTTTLSGTQTFAGANCQRLIETDTSEPESELRNFVVDTGSKIKMYGNELYYNGTLVSSFTFPTPLIYYEYPFSVGQTWTVVDVKGLRMSQWNPDQSDDLDNDGQPDTIDLLITASVTEEENITVPAGSFDAFRIQIFQNYVIHATSVGDYTQSWVGNYIWFVPYIGVIKDESYEIDGQMKELSELKSYQLK